MRTGTGVALVVWCVLLVAVFAAPALLGSSNPGDDLTRNTVRLALAFYAVAVVLMLMMRREEWAAPDGWHALAAKAWRGELARCCWTLAWMAYLVHLAMAFHHYHGWSHARAVEHVCAVSGVGEGIYVSHPFTLVWTLDVAWWWLAPASYAVRSSGIDRLLHGFLLFMIF